MRLASLIRAASGRFAAQPAIGPRVPPTVAATYPRPQPPATMEIPLTHKFFTPSPLAAETHSGVVDMLDIIFRDPSVQHAAGVCAANRSCLLETAGFNSEISAAIEIAIAKDEELDIANITPTIVAEVLRRRAQNIDAAIEECREDLASHEAKSRVRMLRHWPLRHAVGQQLTKLVAERDRLIVEDDAARRVPTADMYGSSRYAVLRGAGLSNAQIEATEPSALNPDILTERRRARLAEIAPQIAALQAFSASPDFNAELLAGLGFEALITARDRAKVVA